jgi:hypothetical protein
MPLPPQLRPAYVGAIGNRGLIPRERNGRRRRFTPSSLPRPSDPMKDGEAWKRFPPGPML